MQVGMQFTRQIGIFINQLLFCVTVHKLLVEPVSVGRLIISIGNIPDSHRLGTVMTANPVRIGQVDANGSRGI